MNRIFCLQQELIGPLVTGKRMAESAAVVVSLTYVPELLWNKRMVRLSKFDQLRG